MNAEEVLRDCVKSGKTKPKRERHTQRVVLLCNELAGRFEDGKVNLHLLTEAAWLHDVAKDQSGDDHHRPEAVKAVIDGYKLDDDLDDVTAIISAHRDKFMPSKHKLESAILRVCDKIDKLNKAQEKKSEKKIEKKTQEAKEACDKSLRKIKDSGLLEDEDFQVIEQFCSDKVKALEGNM